ncbi:envelope glycoprotein L [Psittacid alphaherpesvirus 1]|nr:envelope glycoprotein L [Psittacid alphaherpesvirus 1]
MGAGAAIAVWAAALIALYSSCAAQTAPKTSSLRAANASDTIGRLIDGAEQLVSMRCMTSFEHEAAVTLYGPEYTPGGSMFEDLLTIIFKPQCSPPEAILWYKSGTAVRVNPYYLCRILVLALQGNPRGEVKFVVSRLIAEHAGGPLVRWPTTNVLRPEKTAPGGV